ncbi:MAG: hypothetical protein IKR85_02100 [Clostridia bacterium]|nr:hypothetical protein [Clostridia bacterium]
MDYKLYDYLEDIEARLDLDKELEIEAFWEDWKEYRAGMTHAPAPRPASEPGLKWPDININDALEDDEAMILSEFRRVSDILKKSTIHPLRVRCNYGVGNVATAFGAQKFIMPRETNSLPNVVKLGQKGCAALLEKPLPDRLAGNFKDIFRVAEKFNAIRAKYPKIGRFVRIEQPDLQGPMDNIELLYGSEYFYDLYDEPELIHALLAKMTEFISFIMDEWLKVVPGGTASYFRHIEKGALVIRDDSAMNLSPDMFDEFIAPYDGKLLKKYGGIVHFCGRGDHFIDRLARLEGLRGINMSQPHLNEMEKVLSCTVDKGLHLSLSSPWNEYGAHNRDNLLLLPY